MEGSACWPLMADYVEARAQEIMRRKEEEKRMPVAATYLEIINGIGQDVINCMRDLYQKGKFDGAKTINHPMLIKK